MIADLPPVQVQCIADAIYSEARGESVLGKRAIAHVVLNRAKKRKMTPCQVIRQPRQFVISHRINYKSSEWKKIYAIATWPGVDPTGGASYFHNRTVNPRWRYKITTAIGNHVFYR